MVSRDGLLAEPRVASNDFTRQWQEVRSDVLDAVDRVGTSGWFVLGDEVAAFETELAEWWGVDHVVGVASGLDAIEIALRCAGIVAGDRVLTTPLTAFATTLAIVRLGGEPVWCDVTSAGGLDLEQALAAAAEDPTIRAVVPVHLYGHPLDPAALSTLKDAGLVVIEDCAQSAGARRDGIPTGITGVAGATSFYPTKNLGAMGDGGAVLTGDADLAARARMMRDYGQARRYEHIEVGLNSRLDELQAAILRSALLPRLHLWIERRRQIAARYVDGLRGTRLRPIVTDGGQSANHLFAVEVIEGSPALVAEALAGHGVASARHYPFVCPDQPAAARRGRSLGPLVTARRLAAAEVSLPIYPQLRDDEVDRVVLACQAVCG